MARQNETITVRDTVEAATDKAILLSKLACHCCDRASHSEWIPKSLIIECDQDVDGIERGDEIEIEIPLWLAKEKGLAKF